MKTLYSWVDEENGRLALTFPSTMDRRERLVRLFNTAHVSAAVVAQELGMVDRTTAPEFAKLADAARVFERAFIDFQEAARLQNAQLAETPIPTGDPS